MSIPFIGFLGFIFVGMTLANRILEGAFISSGDVTILNQMTIFRDVTIMDWFSFPVPNLDFLTGVFHMVRFDYSFFGGNAGFILYFLYSLTFAFSVAIFVVVLGLLYNYFNRTR